ncbi:MAG: hypothetical protein Fur002_23520 [Anaerolineales bacterium]
MKRSHRLTLLSFALILALACSLPVGAPQAAQPNDEAQETPATFTDVPPSPTAELPTETPPPSATPEPPTPTAIPHSLIPLTDIKPGKNIVVDAVSVDTAPENRAPYGDSYKYNWFERPFLQDMTYVADMDIASYNLNYDEKFFYVSIETVGSNPNNEIGINFNVELDADADGFGDFIIAAHPPYDVNWSNENLQIFQDSNHDTGGLSAEVAEGPLPGDGYDTLIFDPSAGVGTDFDLAWVRIHAGRFATVQFAFKRTLAGGRFLYGVVADGGLKSVEDMDYVDRFSEEEAGSPERNEPFYPLKKLYGVDNVCREAFGITDTNGLEPQRCKPK